MRSGEEVWVGEQEVRPRRSKHKRKQGKGDGRDGLQWVWGFFFVLKVAGYLYPSEATGKGTHLLSPSTARHPGFLPSSSSSRQDLLWTSLSRPCQGSYDKTTATLLRFSCAYLIPTSSKEGRNRQLVTGRRRFPPFPKSFFFFVPVLELSSRYSPSPAHRSRPLLLLRGDPALCGPIAVAAGHCASGDLSQIAGGSPRRWRQ